MSDNWFYLVVLAILPVQAFARVEPLELALTTHHDVDAPHASARELTNERQRARARHIRMIAALQC